MFTFYTIGAVKSVHNKRANCKRNDCNNKNLIFKETQDLNLDSLL